jgi:putative FmdB family regulatory protein
MPTYEYRCKDCEHELDVVQGFHDDPLTECPSCGGTLRKKFGSVGISFKGSGFYKNDSRSTSSASSGGNGSSGDGSSGDGAASKDAGTKDTSTKEAGSKDTGSAASGSSTSSPASAAATS